MRKNCTRDKTTNIVNEHVYIHLGMRLTCSSSGHFPLAKKSTYLSGDDARWLSVVFHIQELLSLGRQNHCCIGFVLSFPAGVESRSVLWCWPSESPPTCQFIVAFSTEVGANLIQHLHWSAGTDKICVVNSDDCRPERDAKSETNDTCLLRVLTFLSSSLDVKNDKLHPNKCTSLCLQLCRGAILKENLAPSQQIRKDQ